MTSTNRFRAAMAVAVLGRTFFSKRRRRHRFCEGHVLSGGEQTQSPLPRRFQSDGKLDLTVANEGSSNVSIRLGNGTTIP
jgi:hypothetical protein